VNLHSYPSIFNLGHKAVNELLLDPVLIEEKVDGSQFSFAAISPLPDDPPALQVRSKGQEIHVSSDGHCSEKMFQKGVDTVYALWKEGRLHPNWTYRAEYLQKPRHNHLNYSRVPNGHIAIFDIDTGLEAYQACTTKAEEATRLGLDVVPTLYYGMVTDLNQIKDFMKLESFLGGPTIEGVVIKNYHRWNVDKKTLMGKHVSEAFKETQQLNWKKENPGNKDIIQFIGAKIKSEARWRKAIQHLRESGQMEMTPRDIALLFREVPADIAKECHEEIRDALWKWAWPQISRIATAGLAEFYKNYLLDIQFGQGQDSTSGS
jgi:hypothetical protein